MLLQPITPIKIFMVTLNYILILDQNEVDASESNTL